VSAGALNPLCRATRGIETQHEAQSVRLSRLSATVVLQGRTTLFSKDFYDSSFIKNLSGYTDTIF